MAEESDSREEINNLTRPRTEINPEVKLLHYGVTVSCGIIPAEFFRSVREFPKNLISLERTWKGWNFCKVGIRRERSKSVPRRSLTDPILSVWWFPERLAPRQVHRRPARLRWDKAENIPCNSSIPLTRFPE